jgi:catechol 2,3-dioxygenase-like lactoylglutathione lyase family enzyme
MRRREVLVGFGAAAIASRAFAQSDPLEPKSSPASALTSGLAAVTIMSADLTLSRRFYQGAMGMNAQVMRLKGATAANWRRHYGAAGSGPLEMIIFNRPDVPDAAMVRVIMADPALPEARPGHDAEITGALSLGFPVIGNAARDQIVQAMGWKPVAGLTSITLPRGDGTTYSVGETHYRAPDGVMALGIDRADMRPVGPIDSALSIGGPAYSGAMIGDAAKTATFFRDVLGWELRREVELASSGPSGGLGLPAGTRFAFQQWFAPGARTGYLILMDLLNAGKPNARPLGLGNRGLGMWSFSTTKLSEILKRAKGQGVTILSGPAKTLVPGVGVATSLILATPDGLPIEVYGS